MCRRRQLTQVAPTSPARARAQPIAGPAPGSCRRAVAVDKVRPGAAVRAILTAFTRYPEQSKGNDALATDRFLTLADVADVLNISASQTYALVRSGELEAIKIGGRGQWRVEREKLESYISRMYDQIKQFVSEHPLTDADTAPGTD